MQPRPRVETSRPLFPSLRFCIIFRLDPRGPERYRRDRPLKTIRHGQVACPAEDFLHYVGFGVGVLLDVFPSAASQFRLCPGVQLAIAWVGAQPVAECKHAVDFRAAYRKDVKIDIRRGIMKHAMLVPVRLANAEMV